MPVSLKRSIVDISCERIECGKRVSARFPNKRIMSVVWVWIGNAHTSDALRRLSSNHLRNDRRSAQTNAELNAPRESRRINCSPIIAGTLPQLVLQQVRGRGCTCRNCTAFSSTRNWNTRSDTLHNRKTRLLTVKYLPNGMGILRTFKRKRFD